MKTGKLIYDVPSDMKVRDAFKLAEKKAKQ